MKIHRVLIVLTAVNLGLLAILLAQGRPALARDEVGILRGRALQIVDDQGRVRASIQVHPANATFKMPDGKIGYPETVMLRLIDPNGRPSVKLGASVQGAGLGLGGASDPTYIQVIAEGPDTLIPPDEQGWPAAPDQAVARQECIAVRRAAASS